MLLYCPLACMVSYKKYTILLTFYPLHMYGVFSLLVFKGFFFLFFFNIFQYLIYSDRTLCPIVIQTGHKRAAQQKWRSSVIISSAVCTLLFIPSSVFLTLDIVAFISRSLISLFSYIYDSV